MQSAAEPPNTVSFEVFCPVARIAQWPAVRRPTANAASAEAASASVVVPGAAVSATQSTSLALASEPHCRPLTSVPAAPGSLFGSFSATHFSPGPASDGEPASATGGGGGGGGEPASAPAGACAASCVLIHEARRSVRASTWKPEPAPEFTATTECVPLRNTAPPESPGWMTSAET